MESGISPNQKHHELLKLTKLMTQISSLWVIKLSSFMKKVKKTLNFDFQFLKVVNL